MLLGKRQVGQTTSERLRSYPHKTGDYYPVLRTPAFAFGVFGGVYEASYATVSFLLGPESYTIRLNTEQAKEK